MTMLYTLMAALGVMIASLAGIIFINQALSGFLNRNLKVLTAFSGGVFVVLVYSLFAETLELGASTGIILLSALGGVFFLEVVDRLLPHPHDHTHTDERDHPDAHRILIGDAIHNIGDGIILAAAFVIDVRVGLATAAAVFLHEFVQEIAEFFILKRAGYSTRKALAYNFAVSATILVGIVLALAVTQVEQFEAPLLAFAAGAFVSIIMRDILPSITSAIKTEGRALRFAAAAVIGAALLFGLQTLTPHESGHGKDDHVEEIGYTLERVLSTEPLRSSSTVAFK